LREDAVRSLHGFEAVVLVAPRGHDVHSVAEVAGRPGELEDELLGPADSQIEVDEDDVDGGGIDDVVVVVVVGGWRRWFVVPHITGCHGFECFGLM